MKPNRYSRRHVPSFVHIVFWLCNADYHMNLLLIEEKEVEEAQRGAKFVFTIERSDGLSRAYMY